MIKNCSKSKTLVIFVNSIAKIIFKYRIFTITIYKKVLFLVFFPLIATPNQAQMHADSILKIRKNKTCLTVKEARFLEGIRTERAS